MMARTLLVCLLLAGSLEAAGYRNAFQTVEAVTRDYPGLIQGCGGFVDQVAHRLNREDGEIRWGRKARGADGSNPNCDALAYLTDPTDRAKKILIDIVVSSETPGASPAWQEFLGDNPGNGYWTEPVAADLDQTTPPQPCPPCPGCPPSPVCPPCPSPEIDLSAVLARLDVLDAGQALVASDVKGVRTSLEEHRAAVREGKATVLAWLTDWKNYLVIAAGILAGVGLGQ